MEDRTTLAASSRSLLLAVGCTGALLAQCRTATTRLDATLQAVELASFAAQAALVRPLVILIAADLYGLDPEEFDGLARAVGAARVLVEIEEPVRRLEMRLVDALALTRAARAREAAQPRRPSSGIRWAAVPVIDAGPKLSRG
jgi:hypothetical protein